MSVICRLFTICCLTCLAFFSHAQELSCVRGVADYDFWLYLPKKEILKDKPAILMFLHGQNLCGNNLKYLTEGCTKNGDRKPPYGTICEIKNRGREFPAIVVGPQFPAGSAWDADKLITVLDYIEKKYDTDRDRVYVTGMSAGGFGTLRLAGKYPDRITAGAALCGGGDVEDACNLAKVPLWVLCGTNDSKYFVTESKKITDAIKKCNGGPLLSYSSLRGKNHSDMEEYFRTTDTLYNWLFSHTKATSKAPEKKKDTEPAVQFKKEERPATTASETKPTEKVKKNKPFYVVNVIAVSTEDKAQQKAAELKRKGYKANYLWIPDYGSLSGKHLYTVYIGPYSTQETCDAAMKKIKKKFPDAYSSRVAKE